MRCSTSSGATSSARPFDSPSSANFDAEYAAAHGTVSLSRFVYPLGDRARIGDAVSTIEEHHPGQPIWIEAAPSA